MDDLGKNTWLGSSKNWVLQSKFFFKICLHG